MEVDRLNRDAVNLRFGLGKQFEGAQRECAHIRRQLRVRDQLTNLFPAASLKMLMFMMLVVVRMVMIVMVMIVTVFVLGNLSAGCVEHVDFHRGDPASVDG